MSVRKSSKWRASMFRKLIDRDGASCAICSRPEAKMWRTAGVWGSYHDGGRYTRVHLTSTLELEHKVPLWAGGDNEVGNLQLVCHPCHKAKTSAEQSARLKSLGAGRNA